MLVAGLCTATTVWQTGERRYSQRRRRADDAAVGGEKIRDVVVRLCPQLHDHRQRQRPQATQLGKQVTERQP